MGQLQNYNFKNYNLDVYVETGTGMGSTLSKALPWFKKCFSVDIDKEFAHNAQKLYPNSIIRNSLSTEALEYWLKNDIDPNTSVFFFLDAHFPGADFRGAKYDVNAPNAVPLQEELKIIKKYRPNSKDIIVCDDARIYSIGNYQNGNVEWLQVPGGYSFVYDIFPNTKIYIDNSEEGYIIIDRRNI
jgi:hypothetical protein